MTAYRELLAQRRADFVKVGAVSEIDGERVTRIEVKLDQALSRDADHETRIRRLERAFWVAAGVAAPAGGLVGAVVTRLIGMM